MFAEYLNTLNNVNQLSEESRFQLLPHISLKEITQGNFLLKHGDTCRHIYYVNKGFIRIFYYKNGKDITEWFGKEKTFFFSITSYFENVPSKLVIEAVEDCEIIMLSKEGTEKLRRSNIEIANLMISFLSISLILSQQRMESQQFETAMQRYHKLLDEQPEILNKVPLQYIASFLGITQETLSRIRAKK